MMKNYLTSSSRKKFRTLLNTKLVLGVFLLMSLQSMQAQKMERMPVEPVVCPANFEDANSRMAMKQMASKALKSATQKSATAEILITFGPGAQDNAEVQAAFQAAIDIWSEELVSNEPIRISADFANLGAGVLASAGPTTLISNFPNAPEPNIFYPIALANSLAGEDLAPDLEFDLVVNIGSGIPWYFGTDGNTPPGQFDFVTIALHEMGHGLGFIDGGNVNNGTGVGNINNGGSPFTFDTFIVDGAGNSILNLENPSTELGDFLTSGDVFVNGRFAVAALGGTLPELFAPNPFQGGSSIAHWDEATFPAGDPNSLMTPQAGAAESNFDIGDITRGHFRDMGWVLAGQAPIAVNPTSITAELFVGETLSQDISITNISEGDIVVTASTSQGAQAIASFLPEVLNIALSESGILSVGIDTADLPKGIYDETIILSIDGFDVTIEIPVSIRVLDGTETPILQVSPTEFEESIDQFSVVTRDLLITNPGDADLNFNITVNGEVQETFESRAAKFTSLIKSQGFTSERTPSTGTTSLSTMLSGSGTFEKATSTILATGFEDFTTGEVDGQFGWGTQPANFFNISGDAAFEGAQGMRATPDGSGAFGLAFSPAITPGNEPFMTASAQIRIVGNDASFEFIGQSTTEGSVNTRIRFNADGSIDVLDAAAGDFVSTGTTRPEGFFNLSFSIDRDDSSLRVFIDNELIHVGTGFAPLIEQVVFLSDNTGATTIIDVDNVEVTDGDENAFFLSVSPISGIVPFGESLTAGVRFDARALTTGDYTATINITSDDVNTPSIDIPVKLTVLAPPTISVAPNALSEAVDVTVDIPAVKTATFTVSNSGQSNLDFTTDLGPLVFTPPANNTETVLANLNMATYGVGNTNKGVYSSIAAPKNNSFRASRVSSEFANATTINDSIFYDSGIDFPNSFGGVTGQAIATAVKFDAETDFTLTAVRNAYQTETATEVAIILEIYRGGASPAEGELLLTQTTTALAEGGVFAMEELLSPQTFAAGESFWVVHKYPDTIGFPQGQDDDVSNVRPDTYFFSLDGGASFTNIDTFVFLTRALSGDTDGGPYITLTPSSGSVGPGESVDVAVEFNGSLLANGIFETDILVNSNDPITPTAVVATTFEVSGQVNEIEVSDELVLFDNVFVGNTKVNTVTITNNGLGQLNLNSIVSDNEDFTVEPSSAIVNAGEELEVAITFAPSSVGSINGIITINSDASNISDPIEVIVNGVGQDPPMAFLDPQEIFETTAKGTTVNTEIILRNDGNSPLTYSFPDFAVANAMANSNVKLNNTELINFNNFSTTQEKGFVDSRVGHQVEYSLGTDTKFGYNWIDNDEVGGPVYFPFDIRQSGTDLTALVGGDGTAEVALPFPIEYYGVTYESLFINANGFISFQAPTTNLTFLNQQVPLDDGINNVVAAFWADLEPQNGGSVHIAAFADAIVVQWSDAPIFFGADDELVTFKIILFSDGNIEIFYDDVNSASFTSQATVGIENANGTDGAQVAFNTPYIKDGLAVRFVQPEVGLINLVSEISSLSGVIPAGGSRTLTVTLDATELESGTYRDELTVSSNAPDKTGSTSAIELQVQDVLEVVSFVLIDADADTELGVLNDGAILDINTLGTSSFSVVANSSDIPVGSVVFEFNGSIVQTENLLPYSLNGDGNGDFRGRTFPLGTNTITATPFTERSGTGTAGIPLTVTFEVIDTRPVELATFILIDADANTDLGVLNDGAILDINSLGTSNFSVVANTGDASLNVNVNSVVFELNGSIVQTENMLPYSLNGDGNGDFRGRVFPLGTNTITATPFTERGGTGTAGIPLTVTFEVVDTRPIELASFMLINADTDLEIAALNNGDVIDISSLGTSSFSVVANTGDASVNINSVVFELNGNIIQTENMLPYSLNGDGNGDFRGRVFPLGTNTITATPFSKRSGTGTSGTSLTVTFEVVDNSAETQNSLTGIIYPNPVENETQFSMEGLGAQVLQGMIFDISGQPTSSYFDVDINNEGSGNINVSYLSPGIYVIRLTDGNGKIVSTIKMVKE